MNYRNNKTFLGVITLCLLTLPFIIESNSLWTFLGIQRMNPNFFDLHVLLTAIDGYQDGIDVFRDNPLCKYNIPHVYSKAWFIFHYIGFSESNRIFIGGITIILFCGGILYLSNKSLLFLIPFICSPAILLGIERCNNDLLIFLLLLAVCPLALSNKKTLFILSHLLLYLAIALKYYPVAFSLVYLFRSDTVIKRFRNISFHLIFFTIWIFYCWSELEFQKTTLPDPSYYSCFGISPLITVFGNLFKFSKFSSFSIIIILSLVFVFFIYSFYRNNLLLEKERIKNNDFKKSLCLGGISVLLFCYLVRSSFDYRMIFLFFALPYFLNYRLQDGTFFLYKLLSPFFILILFILSSWSESFISFVIQISSEIEIDYILPFYLFTVRLIELFINHFAFMVLSAFGMHLVFTNKVKPKLDF